MNEFGYIENKNEMYISLRINHTLTKRNLDSLTFNFQVNRSKINKRRDLDRYLIKINSMTIYFL